MKFRTLLLVAVTAFATVSAFRGPLGAQGASPPQSVWAGVYTEAQAKRGAAIYSEKCAVCHGLQLEGGEIAPALSGAMFTSNWNGVSLGDMAERIRLTMPEDDPGSLSRQENADVLAYMLSMNRFPPGKSELARETPILNQILFESTKP